jgi:hypothetical protein
MRNLTEIRFASNWFYLPFVYVIGIRNDRNAAPRIRHFVLNAGIEQCQDRQAKGHRKLP